MQAAGLDAIDIPFAAPGAAEGATAADAAAAAASAMQHYKLGGLAPAEYRAELRAYNTQGDASAAAVSARVRVPGGWCGWETAEGGLTCNETMVAIIGSCIAAFALLAYAWRRHARRRAKRRSALLWGARHSVVDDGGDERLTGVASSRASDGGGLGGGREALDARGADAPSWRGRWRPKGGATCDPRDVDAMSRRREERLESKTRPRLSQTCGRWPRASAGCAQGPR